MSISKFMAGALCGVVVGLLIAPEKGEDLRNDLADTAEKWKDRFNRLAGRAETSLDDLRAILDRDIDGLSDDVKHRILTILDDATDMAYSPKPHLSNGVI
jgi:gas vesicle protein